MKAKIKSRSSFPSILYEIKQQKKVFRFVTKTLAAKVFKKCDIGIHQSHHQRRRLTLTVLRYALSCLIQKTLHVCTKRKKDDLGQILLSVTYTNWWTLELQILLMLCYYVSFISSSSCFSLSSSFGPPLSSVIRCWRHYTKAKIFSFPVNKLEGVFCLFT